jgi:hypothetical protein
MGIRSIAEREDDETMSEETLLMQSGRRRKIQVRHELWLI